MLPVWPSWQWWALTPPARGVRHARGNAAPRGPRARRDAMAGAHPRDGIPASGTMSSPSAGVGGGAALLTARGPPRHRARCALILWSLRRSAASRPAARGTWWSAARHAALVLVTRRPPGRASRWRSAAAGEGSRWCGGDGRGSSQRPCALPRLPRGSRGDAPPHTPWPTPWPGSWHALCSLSMHRKALLDIACSQGATDESASYMLSHPTSCLSIRGTESPASLDTHASTSSVQGGVIRPGARTRHGCSSPVLAAPHLALYLDADDGHGCVGARASRGVGAPLACRDGGHTSVPLAMLPADEPTGGSCYVGEPLPWRSSSPSWRPTSCHGLSSRPSYGICWPRSWPIMRRTRDRRPHRRTCSAASRTPSSTASSASGSAIARHWRGRWRIGSGSVWSLGARSRARPC